MCDIRKITFDGANEPVRCRCKLAVLNGYAGMRKSGAAESEAFDAALRIYRFHHPEDSREDSCLTVERWVYAANEQQMN